MLGAGLGERETQEADRTRAARPTERLRPATVRRLRIAAASSLVLLVVLGGAGALWLSTHTPEPRPASTAARPSIDDPIRLDALPPPSSSARSRTKKESDTDPPDDDSSAKSGDRTGEADGDPPSAEAASEADIRRELRALARENAGVVALLSGDRGPGSGTGEVVRPLRGPVTARFGRGWGRLHAGMDIGVPAGTPVHAADSGRVAVSEVMGGYGKFICIQHTGTLSTCYAHNSRLEASKGDSVDSGDVIAQSGCTGRCYGDHLHFEVRVRGKPVNPKDYL